MSQQNLVINKATLATLMGIAEEEAEKMIRCTRYVNMMALSDGENIVVFIPDADSKAVLESQEMWKDLEKNAPSKEKLISLGLAPKE